MTEYRIVKVTTKKPGKSPEDVISVKTSDGTTWPRAAVITALEKHDVFYVEVDGTRAEVEPVYPVAGKPYIRTLPDDRENDNLLRLPPG
jgi:hypothetical protein